MNKHFDNQLEKLKKQIIKMTSLVFKQVKNVFIATENHDATLSVNIISNENEVNKIDLKIDKLCLQLVVLNQPVAYDLRFIFAAITINGSLERIGDLAANIAKGVLTSKYSMKELELINFSELKNIVLDMLTYSTEAFIQQSEQLSKKVFSLEKKLNELKDKASDSIKKFAVSNPEKINSVFFLYDLIHSLERIGDLTTNIVEDVYFTIKAQNIRHKYENIFFNINEE